MLPQRASAPGAGPWGAAASPSPRRRVSVRVLNVIRIAPEVLWTLGAPYGARNNAIR
jgi:hypothetical protein